MPHQMTTTPYSDYFERRAEEERLASERATDKRAAQSHRELAQRYRQRAARIDAPAPEAQDSRGILSADFRILP